LDTVVSDEIDFLRLGSLRGIATGISSPAPVGRLTAGRLVGKTQARAVVATDDVVYINWKVLTWALTQTPLSCAEIAAGLKVSEPQIRDRERNEHPPFDDPRLAQQTVQEV
jgi:hypothetical protein